MYLTECLLKNVGPIETCNVSLAHNGYGSPKPVILVGPNGSGKTILLSHIADALIEFAKHKFTDVVEGQQRFSSPYFKILGGANQRHGTGFGLSLLEFTGGGEQFGYIDTTGALDLQALEAELGGRFQTVRQWLGKERPQKAVSPHNAQYLETFFQNSAVCYFPSSRHERPHWLNRDAITDEAIFVHDQRFIGRLDKPILVESAVEANKRWLLDVVLDSRAEVQVYPTFCADTTGMVREADLSIVDNAQDKLLLLQSRCNVDKLLSEILGDDTAKLVVAYRGAPFRLSIAKKDGMTIPSLDHLSAGQAVLFNTFATIIRYADRGDIHKSIRLHEIEGIVLIDEIDAHLHADMQYKVLPRLIRLFPRVQFIVTSHSPLFLLGMEQEFGNSGIHLLEMPTGNAIGTERFTEFRTSFEYYTRTQAFEEETRSALAIDNRPIVFTEGETDPIYIRAALVLLGRSDLLAELELRPVGRRTPAGTVGGGVTGLNQVRSLAEGHPDLAKRKVLLLYDCDSNKPSEDANLLSVRAIPKNEDNTKVRKGIENLLPLDVFEERFYTTRETVGDYGEQNVIQNLDKMALCRYLCEESRERKTFERFAVVVSILDEFLGSTCAEAQGAGESSSVAETASP